MISHGRVTLGFLILTLILSLRVASAERDLSSLIRSIKPGIVGIGVHSPLARPPDRLMGSGFYVADGRHVITNYHVVKEFLKPPAGSQLAVYVGRGVNGVPRQTKLVLADEDHDVALLRIEGIPGAPLSLRSREIVSEGARIAFTGYPIGAVYGLFPVTHQGIISAITPIAIPQALPGTLDPGMIRRLNDRYDVYQLDATAYPGNSGSPVYSIKSGKVVGILSSVFVKESREKILSDPSGISFAIPIQYARALIEKAGLEMK